MLSHKENNKKKFKGSNKYTIPKPVKGFDDFNKFLPTGTKSFGVNSSVGF